MKPATFTKTREVVIYSLKYVSGRTLDLGAGTAKYKGLIQKHCSEYVTFDLMPGENIDFVGDINNTGFKSSNFDTIISTQVFEHIAKPWEAVKEIHRLLKPGGVCIITAPFLQPYHADPYDFYRYTIEGMKVLFSDGFEIIEAQPYTKFFSTFAEFIHHTLLSPYKNDWRGKARLVRYVASIGFFLDRFVRIGRVYGNVYMVVRKN